MSGSTSSSVPPAQGAAASSSSSTTTRSPKCDHGGSVAARSDSAYITHCLMRYAAQLRARDMVGCCDIFEELKRQGHVASSKKMLLQLITDLLLDAGTINDQLQLLILMYHEMDAGDANRRLVNDPCVTAEQKKRKGREDFQLMTKATRSKLDAIRFIKPLIPCHCLDEQKKALKAQPRVRLCDYCQKNTSKSKLMLCSRCKSVEFCGKECQRAAWKHHKLVCQMIGD